MRMMLKISAGVLLAGVATLLITAVYAGEDRGGPPQLPHAFYGKAEINGSPTPMGTEVEARGEGVIVPAYGNPLVTIFVGAYGSLQQRRYLVVQGSIADGDIVTFYINGFLTGQTAEWHSGALTEIDLAVTIN